MSQTTETKKIPATEDMILSNPKATVPANSVITGKYL